MRTHHYIVQRRPRVPVRQLCQVLGVAPSAYHAWQRCQLCAQEPPWQVAVRKEFGRHSARCGARRLRAELHAQGHLVGRWCIRRTLAAGLRAQPPRSFVPRTTDSDPNVRAAPNRLLGQPTPTAPNQVWVGDITYLPRQGGGWRYLTTWLGRHSRKVVGWVCTSPCPKLWSAGRCPVPWLCAGPRLACSSIPTRAVQYSATSFKALLARHEVVQSRSRRGNCYDHAPAESFWSRLKSELLNGGSFRNSTEARLESSHYLAYYNAESRYSSLGYSAPNYFEIRFQTTPQLCAA